MEMDLIDFRAMYLGLRRRDALIDRKRFFLYCLRNRKSCNQTADLRHAMMRMVMRIMLVMVCVVVRVAVMTMRIFLRMRMCMHVMVMFVVVLMYMVMFMFVVVLMRMVMVMLMRMPTWHSTFLLAMNQHPHMRAGNAALFTRLCFKNHTRDSHGIQLGKRGFLIRHQFQESRGQHIARRPHRTFDI